MDHIVSGVQNALFNFYSDMGKWRGMLNTVLAICVLISIIATLAAQQVGSKIAAKKVGSVNALRLFYLIVGSLTIINFGIGFYDAYKSMQYINNNSIKDSLLL